MHSTPIALVPPQAQAAGFDQPPSVYPAATLSKFWIATLFCAGFWLGLTWMVFA